MVELNNDEQHVSKKRKLIGGYLATRTRSATKAEGGISTFTLEDNLVDSIIRADYGSWKVRWTTLLQKIRVESSEDGKTSSSYSDLIPHDMVEIQGVVVGGGNQHVEEVDHVDHHGAHGPAGFRH